MTLQQELTLTINAASSIPASLAMVTLPPICSRWFLILTLRIATQKAGKSQSRRRDASHQIVKPKEREGFAWAIPLLDTCRTKVSNGAMIFNNTSRTHVLNRAMLLIIV